MKPSPSDAEQPMSLRDQLYYDLAGVLADTKDGEPLDAVCRETLLRVQSMLDAALSASAPLPASAPLSFDDVLDAIATRMGGHTYRAEDAAVWSNFMSLLRQVKASECAVSEKPAIPEGWKFVSANDTTRGVAWIDREATHVGTISALGQRHLLRLPSRDGNEEKGK